MLRLTRVLFVVQLFFLLLFNTEYTVSSTTFPSSTLPEHRSSGSFGFNPKHPTPSTATIASSTSASSHQKNTLFSPPESVRVIGKQQWEQLLAADHYSKSTESSVASSCWHIALNRFREVSLECNSASERIKTLLAMTLTKCHFMTRGTDKGFPLQKEHCDLDEAFEMLQQSMKAGNPEFTEKLQSGTNTCLSHLSDSAFEVYIQFFNHLDNICFFLHSQVWQERTEDTVNRLTYISAEVASKLDEVNKQHLILLGQQRVSLQHQQKLMMGSKRIEQALDSGHTQLQSVFSDMRHEVQKEQKRLVSIFDDTFHLISRILQLQQHVVGRLTDFETLLTYVVLVITTFYLTAADSTRSIRATLYAFWSFMSIVEVLIWRFYVQLEFWALQPKDAVYVRFIMRRWRLLCICVGFLRWCYAWWRYRDTVKILVDSLHDGIKELKEHIQTVVSHHDPSSSAIPQMLLASRADHNHHELYPYDYAVSPNHQYSTGALRESIISFPHVPFKTSRMSLGDGYRDIFDRGDGYDELDSDYTPSTLVIDETDEDETDEDKDNTLPLSSGRGETHSIIDVDSGDDDDNDSDDSASLASGDWSVIQSNHDTGGYNSDTLTDSGYLDRWGIERIRYNPRHRHDRNTNTQRVVSRSSQGSRIKRSSCSVDPSMKYRRPHRRCRPIVNRAPIPGVPEDFKYLKLNPILLFETEEEFVDNYNAFIQHLKDTRQDSSRPTQEEKEGSHSETQRGYREHQNHLHLLSSVATNVISTNCHTKHPELLSGAVQMTMAKNQRQQMAQTVSKYEVPGCLSGVSPAFTPGICEVEKTDPVFSQQVNGRRFSVRGLWSPNAPLDLLSAPAASSEFRTPFFGLHNTITSTTTPRTDTSSDPISVLITTTDRPKCVLPDGPSPLRLSQPPDAELLCPSTTTTCTMVSPDADQLTVSVSDTPVLRAEDSLCIPACEENNPLPDPPPSIAAISSSGDHVPQPSIPDGVQTDGTNESLTANSRRAPKPLTLPRLLRSSHRQQTHDAVSTPRPKLQKTPTAIASSDGLTIACSSSDLDSQIFRAPPRRALPSNAVRKTEGRAFNKNGMTTTPEMKSTLSRESETHSDARPQTIGVNVRVQDGESKKSIRPKSKAKAKARGRQQSSAQAYHNEPGDESITVEKHLPIPRQSRKRTLSENVKPLGQQQTTKRDGTDDAQHQQLFIGSAVTDSAAALLLTNSVTHRRKAVVLESGVAAVESEGETKKTPLVKRTRSARIKA